MAMRPTVKRNAWLIIGFAIAQCVIVQIMIHQQMLDLTTNQRVAIYTLSGIACATLLFLACLYMALKGNADNYP
jgi:DMSO/TMAO reductase YedYZ heme-binding membrane subunit